MKLIERLAQRMARHPHPDVDHDTPEAERERRRDYYQAVASRVQAEEIARMGERVATIREDLNAREQAMRLRLRDPHPRGNTEAKP